MCGAEAVASYVSISSADGETRGFVRPYPYLPLTLTLTPTLPLILILTLPLPLTR